MPIVVTEPAPSTPFGWGHLVDIITDTPGPFLPPLTWELTMMDSDLAKTWGEQTVSVTDPHVPTQVKFTPSQSFAIPMQNAFQQSRAASLRVQLVSSGTVSEQLVVPVQLDVLGWLNEQATKQAAAGSGFTTEDRALLQQTQGSTFLSLSLDELFLEELTSGAQGGFVNANLGVWIYGVIVRIATVPADFRVDTADGDYWLKSLAVVRIYRGSDVWKRVPVHTSSKLISFVEEGLVSAVAALLPIQWLVGISVQVSFAEGVTGRVFLMRQP